MGKGKELLRKIEDKRKKKKGSEQSKGKKSRKA